MNTAQTRLVWVSLLVVTGLTGCAAADQAPPSATPTRLPLTAYHSPTPSPQGDAAAANLPESTPTPPPPPTATPFLYAIESGDTLLEVAQRYNITLEQLLAANPGIDPSFLIVGTEIVIPTGETSLAAYPSPTPIAFALGAPHCYPTADGGLWCLVLAKNTQAQALENLAAEITLYDHTGEQLARQVATAALNVLGAEAQIPLVAYFPTAGSATIAAQAKPLSALPVAADSARYLPLEIEIKNIHIAGTQANLRGQLRIPGGEGTSAAARLWLAASAYDADGRPVGTRKLVSEQTLAPGSKQPFDITVFSLGPVIHEVQILGEARPAP